MLLRQNCDPIWSKLLQATTSRKRPPEIDILDSRLREVRLYIIDVVFQLRIFHRLFAYLLLPPLSLTSDVLAILETENTDVLRLFFFHI